MSAEDPRKGEPLLFEIGKEGRRASSVPSCDVPKIELTELIPKAYLRTSLQGPAIPELSEPEVIRHFTRLSQRNMGVDSNFYPLGSCTMKYNPKINEDIANLSYWELHPYLPSELVQGALQVLYELEQYLAEISGMSRVTLAPSAGAHGEITALFIIKAYHESKGRSPKEVLVPNSAHGTNPASAALAGFVIRQIASNNEGTIDIEDLQRNLSENTAALMLTNPNTLGLFEKDILTISSLVHKNGGLVYYDGANLNAILGITKPADMDVDLMHFNLHKTFSTPHGGGGPGSGPVGVKEELVPFLPVPVIEKREEIFFLDYDKPHSIGKIRSFYANFLVCLKAYTYIRTLGPDGLKEVSENAVLNANYLLKKLTPYFEVPYEKICQHEFVLSAKSCNRKYGVRALDIAKRLLDYGFHAPTIYFPLIVEEAMMIEPTETESKETLDKFSEVLIKICEEAKNNPELVKTAPHKMPVGRLDEAKAAREPKLKYQKPKN